MDAVIYTRDGCEESQVMRDYLRTLGIESRMRAVDGDAVARREWEDLDGERLPMFRLGSKGIVRGLDRIKVQQLVGWVGC